MRTIHVNLAHRSYPIYFGSGLVDQIGALYTNHKLGRQAAIITDQTVHALYANRIKAQLESAQIETTLITLPPGEETKSLSIADRVYEQLLHARLERSSTIIALGGGVIGDLAGFIAATYLRGVNFVQMPTTLMAQVDSSIGGKTGINHRLGKNLIGAFYQPQFVLIDPSVLSTLLEREFWSGMSEVIKYSLIQDAQLFSEIKNALDQNKIMHESAFLSQVIPRCCEIKATITSTDERETGLRRILNFGHTIGHALEAASQFSLKHGEAVAWGMIGAAWLSHRKKRLAYTEMEEIIGVLKKFPKPALADISSEAIMEYIYRDKKVQDKKVQFVLLSRIGEAIIWPDISDADLREALHYLRSLSSSRP